MPPQGGINARFFSENKFEDFGNNWGPAMIGVYCVECVWSAVCDATTAIGDLSSLDGRVKHTSIDQGNAGVKYLGTLGESSAYVYILRSDVKYLNNKLLLKLNSYQNGRTNCIYEVTFDTTASDFSSGQF